MVKIKMIKTACGPFGSYMANGEYDVSSEVAEQLKAGDACVILRPVSAPKVEVAKEPEPPKVEVAKVENKPKPKKAPAKFTPGKE